MTKSKLITVSFFSAVLLSGCVPYAGNPRPTLHIASFNLASFGTVKASNAEILDAYARIIRHFDVIALQEIQDAGGTAIASLLNKINETGRTYDFVIGPRLGRTSSKEQYAFLYDSVTVTPLSGAYTFDDDGDGNGSNDEDDSTHPGDLFEREPLIANFKAGRFDFVLVNIHTQAGDVQTEVGYLPAVMADAETRLGDSDVICLGDYNADGAYYDEDELGNVFPGTDYVSIVDNAADTMSTASTLTYDRIIAKETTADDFSGEWGIMIFEQIIDFGSLTIAATDVSDHYPVWAEYYE